MNHGQHTFKTGVDVSPIHELLINLFQGARRLHLLGREQLFELGGRRRRESTWATA